MRVQIGHHRRGSQGQHEAIRREDVNINSYREVWAGELDVHTFSNVRELFLISNPTRPDSVSEVRQIIVGDLVVLHTSNGREIYRATSDGWQQATVNSWTPPLRP
jgi:hypothetical protein